MQNKVVVIYRNDEVAHAAVNALLQDGFSFDQIYISSPTDNEQVRYYDRIGENALLPQLDSELGRFYRSIGQRAGNNRTLYPCTQGRPCHRFCRYGFIPECHASGKNDVPL